MLLRVRVFKREDLYLKGYHLVTGFEYGCVVSKGEVKIYAGQNASGNELYDYRSWVLLGKKVQVWIVKKDIKV